MESGHRLNQYVFVKKLGDGGMGEVWRGKHSYLDYEVAIKFLKSQFAQDADLQERFLNEGKRQASLDHPNIVRATDFITEDGRNFLVMKFVEGQALDKRIEEAGGPLPIEETLDIAYQVLSALEYAHRAGVVHRDVKPSNILIDRQGQCFLTDFGIALAVGQLRVTRTGTVIGTAHYMSPEQIRRPHTVDFRTDVYAFGVVLFEMLTGVAPFDAEGGNEFLVKQAHVQQAPPKPSKLNQLVSKPLENVVLCAMAKEPEKRWSSCEEMSNALQLAAQGRTIVPGRVTEPAGRTHTPARSIPPSGNNIPIPNSRGRTTPTPVPVRPDNWLSRNWRGMAALAALFVLSIIVGVAAKRYFSSRSQPDVAIYPPPVLRPEPSKNDPVKPDRVAPPKPVPIPPSKEVTAANSRENSRVTTGISTVPTPDNRPPTRNQNEPVSLPPDSSVAGKPPVTAVGNTTSVVGNTSPSEVKPPSTSEQAAQTTETAQVTRRPVGDPGIGAKPPLVFRPDPVPPTGTPPAITKPELPESISGTFKWSVELRKGDIVSLTGTEASSGRVFGGALPGKMVNVSISPPDTAGVVEAPSPSNGYKTLKLRGLRNANVVLTIQWTRL